MANFVYDKLKAGLIDGSINLTTDTIKVLLVQEINPTIVVSAAMVGDTMDTSYAGSSATPLTETSGVGYTAGGKTLTGTSATSAVENGLNVTYFDADDVNWSSSTITAGGVLLYKDASPYTSGTPLAYLDFSANRVSSNGDFQLIWNSTGILELTA